MDLKNAAFKKVIASIGQFSTETEQLQDKWRASDISVSRYSLTMAVGSLIFIAGIALRSVGGQAQGRDGIEVHQDAHEGECRID